MTQIYAAPMEGLTTGVFRKAHRALFSGIDRYYLPFIAVHESHTFKQKEIRDMSPSVNAGMVSVPQILTKNPADFVWGAREIAALGYDEINLNLGCPSPTVTTKKKGAGLLGDSEALQGLLDGIFEGLADLPDLRITVKTRLGIAEPQEMEALTELYNRYPVAELIIHARTLQDLYRGEPRMEAFRKAYEDCRMPVSFNGNIFSREDFDGFISRYPETAGVMLGRGLIRNPALAREIRGGEKLTREELRAFHDAIYQGYLEEMSGITPVLGRMKELWSYWGTLFPENERLVRNVRKAKNRKDYETAAGILFNMGSFRNEDRPREIIMH